MISGQAVKNVGLAAAGLVVGEKLGGMIAGRLPGPSWLPGAALAVGGLFLGSRGGLVGKLGYGAAVTGVLHVVSGFTNAVDVDFSSF